MSRFTDWLVNEGVNVINKVFFYIVLVAILVFVVRNLWVLIQM